MWFFLALALGNPHFMENKDVAHAFKSLEVRMFFLVERFNRNESMPPLSWLNSEIERLEGALANDAEHRPHIFDGPSILLEAKNQELFDKPPVAPPESKNGGRWTFPTIRLEVLPRHLYIYGLKLQGKNTLRLSEVTLFFHDGPARVHGQWQSMGSGNGAELSDQTFTPILEAWPEGTPRKARRLAAIEIVGSAQDGAASSELEFVMEVPDPEARPFEEARDLAEALRKRLSARTVNAALLNACLADLVKLAKSLGLETQPGPSARE